MPKLNFMLKFILSFFLLMSAMQLVSHPFILSLGLILYSCGVGVFLFNFVSLWAMNMIMLVFLGGMMVILLYVSTLSNSEKFIIDWLNIWSLIIVSLILNPSWLEIKSLLLMENMYDFSLLFKLLGSGVLYFMILYLLLALFSVMKLSENFKGAFMKKK